MIRIQSAIAAAAAAFAMSAPSQAQEFTFDYEAWMLSSAQGRTMVLDRLERRVDNYCHVREARGALQVRIATDCKTRVLERAIEQIGDPRITALHQSREQSRRA